LEITHNRYELQIDWLLKVFFYNGQWLSLFKTHASLWMLFFNTHVFTYLLKYDTWNCHFRLILLVHLHISFFRPCHFRMNLVYLLFHLICFVILYFHFFCFPPLKTSETRFFFFIGEVHLDVILFWVFISHCYGQIYHMLNMDSWPHVLFF